MPEVLALAAELRRPESRAETARALATTLGAEALLIFVHDDERGALLPVPGFPQSLPDERRWRDFLDSCTRDAHALAPLPFGQDGAELCADGYAWERNAVFVLLAHERIKADVRWLRALLPLLYDTFHGEQITTRTTARARSASETTAQALDDARHAVDRANQAKTEFLATMSHELRTPLNAIGGYVQLLQMGLRGPVTAEQHHALDRIDRAQRHLLGLINDILNLSRIEAGHVEYTLVAVPLRELLEEVAPMIQPQIAAKRLQYDVLDPATLPVVCADREKLQQIFLNLLSNAVKFTEPEGRIWVEADEMRDGPHDVVIRVSDTGCGLPANKLEAIFEPFVQVRADLSRLHEGTGLGLSISRDLARAMGGELLAEQRVNGGSTFVLTLPRG